MEGREREKEKRFEREKEGGRKGGREGEREMCACVCRVQSTNYSVHKHYIVKVIGLPCIVHKYYKHTHSIKQHTHMYIVAKVKGLDFTFRFNVNFHTK